MIKIISINKQGNKIIDYSCESDGAQISLTKEQLVEKINNKEVSNAHIQIYKGQTIIRVNLGDKPKREVKNKDIASENRSKTRKESNKPGDIKIGASVTSEQLMKVIADVFKISHFEQFSERFFDRNKDLVGKEFDNNNTNDKVKAMRKMVTFWKMVAYKEADLTLNILMESIDNMEYEAYCKENNIVDDEN